MIVADRDRLQSAAVNGSRERDPAFNGLRLLAAEGVGPVAVGRMLAEFGTVNQAVRAPESAYAGIQGGTRMFRAIHAPATVGRAREWYARLKHLDLTLLVRGESDYPRRLGASGKAPVVLFVCGRLPASERAVAVVGSRRATEEGRAIARAWGADFARAGFTVISGMARGIDGAAHLGAIDVRGRSVAVLGCGTDIIYPPEHASLRARLLGCGGAVVSQYWPDTRAGRGLFVARNATIAGLAEALVVVEAAEESGALGTVAAAMALGRPVFVVPGSVQRHNNAGSNRLLQRGARIALRPEDVTEALGKRCAGRSPSPPPDLSSAERTIYGLLGVEGQDADVLARRLGMPAAELMTRLLNLELRGLVRQLAGKRFARRRLER